MSPTIHGKEPTSELVTNDYKHSHTLISIFLDLIKNRQLIYQMSQREIMGRYKESILGLFWSFFNPIILLCVYTFVFSVVFKARWGTEGDDSKTQFAVVLYVGMIVHGLFSECLNAAPHIISNNTSYVKRLVFPLQVLPWVSMSSAMFNAGIGLFVLLIVQFVLSGNLPWTAIFAPIIFLPLVLTTMGFSWFLAATGVYVRDIRQTTGIFTTVLLFLSPVFYPISILPPNFQLILLANPLTFIIEQARGILIWNRIPDFGGLVIYSLASLGIAWMGFWWFQKTRNGFSDVL